jgi:putative tryptophan/tyrosine transport system substrate-binding protein
MQRREFIGLIGATALSIPRPGYAQTKTDVPLVGLLLGYKPDTIIARDRITALRKGLQEEGFVEGTNYSLAVRFAEGDLNRYPQLVMELGALKPRVIVTVGYATGNFSRLVPDVPMVFTGIAADPIAYGLAQSYVHPGGMITGNVMNAVGGEEAMAQKRIGLFKQLVPNLTRLGMIAPAVIPPDPQKQKVGFGFLAMKEKEALQKVAAQLDFEVVHYDLNTIDDLESAFAAGLRDDVSAFYISTEPLLFANLSRVMTFVTASRKPSVGTIPDWGRAGLLMSYATDLSDGFRHAGIYVAKIIGGTKPGDLPIEQASKFTLVINQKTAKTLGITVPPTLLALADEVIE